MKIFALILAAIVAFAAPAARAEFILSSAILEFTGDGPQQQDIEVISRSQEKDYVEAKVYEILNPGSAQEERRLVKDPAQSGLLVTPDKSVLPGGGRKIMRFVLLKKPADQERIYRVTIEPVIKGVEHDSKVGLKVLVGYEVLVIVRPSTISPSYQARREGNAIVVSNSGNTNVLFSNGQQCVGETCDMAPVARVYPGQTTRLDLPKPGAVTYSIWNGIETVEKNY